MVPTLVLLIVTPFLGAGLALLLSARWAGRIALVPPAVVLALALPFWPVVARGGTVTVPVRWLPSLGITATLYLDHLGAFFVLLVAGVGLGVVQYSRVYLGRKATPTYWAALLAFMGAMIGLVLSDSLVLLFVFWELTTVLSALLIALDPTDPEARSGSVRAFLVTSAGGLAMLAGIVLLEQETGTYNLSELESHAAALISNPTHVACLTLLLLGAFTKSAQFPFHFWLPGAMAAPAPVSAYLHSATMVNAGIFLMLRLSPSFHTSPVWQPLLVTVGLTTFLVAGWDAVRAWDLKKLLAYSTVAYLGVLTALSGVYPGVGARGMIVNIANHAFYKAALFLLVGWMEKVTGTRDLSVLRDEHWFRREPLTGVLIGIGAFAMAGFPLVLGFLSKEILYELLLENRSPGGALAVAAAVGGSVLAVTYSLKLFVSTFWGAAEPHGDVGHPRHEISLWMLVVPALLLVPQVLGGIAPGFVAGSILEPGTEWPRWIAIWHHLDTLLVLSLTTITLGITGYVLWRRVAVPPHEPETQLLSDRLAAAILGLSVWVGRLVQAGGHPRYLTVMLLFATATAVAAVSLANGAFLRALSPWGPDPSVVWLPALLILVGAALTPVVRSRVTKLMTMAIAGYGTALFYLAFRAPDLVLTQILVETVTLVLLLLAFRRLPERALDLRPPRLRVWHAVVAGITATGAATLAVLCGALLPEHRAGAQQLDLAWSVAGGRNAVNVILVDFRGADTLGEITVLAIAALGVVALLRGDSKAKSEKR